MTTRKGPAKDVKEKDGKKRARGSRRAVDEAIFKEFPGFMYIAKISAGFRPTSLFGGFTSLTGYQEKDFFITDFYDTRVVDPGDLSIVRSYRNKAINESTPAEISYHLKTLSGNKVLVSERISILGNGDHPPLIGGIVSVSSSGNAGTSSTNNGSEALQILEIKKMNEHLKEVNDIKDEFLAWTSHELRTPLNSIIGFLTMMTDGYYGNDDELKMFTKNALDSSRHLLNVINDILDVSKIEAGSMQVLIEKVRVDKMVEEVRSVLELQAKQKGLILECSTETSHLSVAADVQKLRQVLINIVGNAIKFTPAGTVKLTANPRDGKVVFVVMDTGIGIPTDKIGKLFHKFVQIDGNAARKFGGAGLGLAISKHFVEMMGGKIEIESKGLGTGTTVRLSIPVWTKEEG